MVHDALMATEGVESCVVSLEEKTATVKGTAPPARLIRAVNKTGKIASLAKSDIEDVKLSTVMGSIVVDGTPAGPHEGLLVAKRNPDPLPTRVITGGVLVGNAPGTSPSSPKGRVGGSMSMESRAVVNLAIGGMSCASCSAAIEKHLDNAPGVYSIRVNLLAERARVDYNPSQIDTEWLTTAIKGIGFTASVHKTEGTFITLTASVIDPDHVRATLAALSGVVSVEFPEEESFSLVEVQHNREVASVRSLLHALGAAGFSPKLPPMGTGGKGQDKRAEDIEKYRFLLIVSASFTLPVFVISMILPHFAVCQAVLTGHVLPGLELQVVTTIFNRLMLLDTYIRFLLCLVLPIQCIHYFDLVPKPTIVLTKFDCRPYCFYCW